MHIKAVFTVGAAVGAALFAYSWMVRDRPNDKQNVADLRNNAERLATELDKK